MKIFHNSKKTLKKKRDIKAKELKEAFFSITKLKKENIMKYFITAIFVLFSLNSYTHPNKNKNLIFQACDFFAHYNEINKANSFCFNNSHTTNLQLQTCLDHVAGTSSFQKLDFKIKAHKVLNFTEHRNSIIQVFSLEVKHCMSEAITASKSFVYSHYISSVKNSLQCIDDKIKTYTKGFCI